VAACPTNNGCIPLETPTDYWDKWFTTYNRLMSQLNQEKPAEYWYQWFDSYSQKLSKQIQERKRQTAGVAL
jgi:lysophospholipase L1-like esterase